MNPFPEIKVQCPEGDRGIHRVMENSQTGEALALYNLRTREMTFPYGVNAHPCIVGLVILSHRLGLQKAIEMWPETMAMMGKPEKSKGFRSSSR